MQTLDEFCEQIDDTPDGCCPIDDYFKAYYDCRKHKRRTLNAVEFELHYERYLIELYNEVNNRTYKIGKSICFYITRPTLREVFAADFRDRVIHHLVIRKLEPLFEKIFIYDNYNCRVGKGVLCGIKRLKQLTEEAIEEYGEDDLYYGKFDMSGFFMSINKNILWSMLKSFIDKNYFERDKETVLWLCKEIIFNKPQENCIVKGDAELLKKLPPNKSLFYCATMCGLPIGNLSSQVFANFLLVPFDRIMKFLFKYYGRYVDDFFVIGKKILVLLAYRFAKAYLYIHYKITLSPKKIYIQKVSNGIKFIGSVIKHGRIYAGNQTVSNIFNKIEELNKKCSQEEAEHFMQTINSYLGFLKHANSYAIVRNMFDKINDKWWEFVENMDFKKINIKKDNQLVDKTTKQI